MDIYLIKEGLKLVLGDLEVLVGALREGDICVDNMSE